MLVGAGVLQALAQPYAPLEVVVSTEKDVYYLGEEVQLLILIRNVSGETLEVIEPAVDRRSLNIEIIQPGGMRDRMLAIYGLKLDTVRLPAKRRIRFTTSFTPEALGTFTVHVTYSGYGAEIFAAAPREVFVVQKKRPL